MPVSVERAPWTVVKQIILGWFSRSFGPEYARFPVDLSDADADRGYSLIDPDGVSAILECDPRVERGLYQVGCYDCEDYAVAVRSAVAFDGAQKPQGRFPLPVALGCLFSVTHSLNLGIAPDRKPYLYDHYNNRVWKEESLDGALEDLPDLGTGWLKSVRYVLI